MVLTPCFTLDVVSVSSQLCFVNNNLVLFKQRAGKSREHNAIEVYNDSGMKIEEWNTCSHDNEFQSFMALETEGKEYLLKGCTQCMVIEGYGFQSGDAVLFDHVTPKVMCNGPGDTIFVYDDRNKSILQLRYMVWGEFLLAFQIRFAHNDVTAMCFSDQCDTLIVVIG